MLALFQRVGGCVCPAVLMRMAGLLRIALYWAYIKNKSVWNLF